MKIKKLLKKKNQGEFMKDGEGQPCNEENPTFLAILFDHKIKIIDSISTLINKKIYSEILIALSRLTNLFNNNLLFLLLDLENYEAVNDNRDLRGSSICRQYRKDPFDDEDSILHLSKLR
ncbi:unnamed protein product, partial [Vitis vinifera]